MSFSQKLSTILKIFNISNSRLAKQLNIDASLVSRWKSGERTPKQQRYYAEIAHYIVTNANLDYQKYAICETIGANIQENLDEKDMCSLLTSWLSNSSLDNELKMNTSNTHYTKTYVEIYYGLKGKQQAIIKFLETILASEKIYELLLISEENMDWLTGDKEFLQKWEELLTHVIGKGNTIKIIHTIQRNIGELTKIVEKWLPLHLCGRVVSYYYPKYKEFSFARTIFIAPNLVSLTSSNLNNSNTSTANYLFFDKQVIATCVKDFELYIQECEPLMNVITNNNFDNYKAALNPFVSYGNVIMYRSSLPLFSFPLPLLDNLLHRLNINNKTRIEIKETYLQNIRDFEKMIDFNNVSLLVEQKTLENLLKADLKHTIDDRFSNTSISYMQSEIGQHIKHLIKMLTEHDSFNMYILDSHMQKLNVSVVAKENEYIFATNLTNPKQHYSVIYNEKNITDAIYEYFSLKLDTITNKQKSKDYTINMLNKLLFELHKVDDH